MSSSSKGGKRIESRSASSSNSLVAGATKSNTRTNNNHKSSVKKQEKGSVQKESEEQEVLQDPDNLVKKAANRAVQQIQAADAKAFNYLARRGSEAEKTSEEEFDDEAMANAERELAADAEWKRIQQNTFTRWANEHLKQAATCKQIDNLATDLSDGLKLIALIEVLSGKKMPRHNKKPNFRSQKLENVSIALKFLEMEGVTLVNIDSTDIVDCKLKLILGLIWTLILHYAISMPMWDGPPLGGGPAAQEKTPKQRLMNWIQDKVPDLPVNNFTKDWQDGKAVGALVDSVAPGLCPDWDTWDPNKPVENAREAMDLADKWLNVPKLLQPEEIVNPNIDEQSMMTYLSQFPNAKLKPGAPLRKKTNVNKVRAYGPGIEPTGLVANAPAKFTVETFGAGDGDVTVNVTDPDGNSVPSEVAFNHDRKKSFSCQYFPEKEGDYKVKVNFANREIPKSPYRVNVEGFAGDAGKVTASGPGLEAEGVVVNKPTYFHIYAKNAGKGKPEVVIIDPKGKKDSVPVKISPTEEDEVYKCEYITPNVGLHSINVFFAGNAIPKSPFGVRVSPASNPGKVWTSGKGLQPNGIRVNETVDFNVHTDKAGEGNVGVKILGPGGLPVRFVSKKLDDFTTQYTYTPVNKGRHIVMITFANQEIPKSPFEVNISPFKRSSIKAYGPGLKGGIVDKPAKFTVDTCGETGALGFSIKGPSQAEISCADNGDGSADVEYIPTAEGEYAVHILCDDEDIPGSPYMAQIVPQTDYFPENVKVYGPGVENGVNPKETTHFTVDITDAGDAPLDVSIVDDLGSFEPKTKEVSDGIFDCSYKPRKNQPKQNVLVNFGGVAVPGSPFRVQNDNPNDPSKVRVFGPGVERGVRARKPIDFTIDCKKSGPGDLKVSIESKSRKSVPISMADNKDGTHKVTYEPTEPGSQTIVITLDGTEVPQSPIKLDVLPGIDLSKIKLKDFETDVFVDCTNEFEVDASALPENHKASVTCDITGPSGDPVDNYVNKVDPNGTFQVSYIPNEEGKHDIALAYDGQPLPDSPYPVVARHGSDPGRVKAYGDGLEKAIVDEPNEFTIETKNAGAGGLGLAIEGPSEAIMNCVDNKDGTATVEYTPTEEGDYDIQVKFGDEHIPGSPFQVPATTRDGIPKANAEKVRAYGPGLEPGEVLPGKPTNFVVDATETGPAVVDVDITNETGEKIPRSPIILDKGDGTHEVSYVPPPVGEPYQINVYYGGVEIPESPFEMTSNPDMADVINSPASITELGSANPDLVHAKNGPGIQRKETKDGNPTGGVADLVRGTMPDAAFGKERGGRPSVDNIGNFDDNESEVSSSSGHPGKGDRAASRFSNVTDPSGSRYGKSGEDNTSSDSDSDSKTNKKGSHGKKGKKGFLDKLADKFRGSSSSDSSSDDEHDSLNDKKLSKKGKDGKGKRKKHGNKRSSDSDSDADQYGNQKGAKHPKNSKQGDQDPSEISRTGSLAGKDGKYPNEHDPLSLQETAPSYTAGRKGSFENEDPNRRGSRSGKKSFDRNDPYGSAYGPDGKSLDPNDRRGSGYGPDGRPLNPNDRRGSAYGPDGRPLDPNDRKGSAYGPDGRPLDSNDRRGSGYGPDGRPLDPNDRRGSAYGPDGRPLDPNDRKGSAYGPDGRPLDSNDRRGSGYGPDGRPLDPNDRRGSAYGPDGRPLDPNDRKGSAYGPDGRPLDSNDRRGSGHGPDGRPLDPNDRRGSAYGPDGRPLDPNDRKGSAYGPDGRPLDSNDRRGSGYGPDGRPLDPNDRKGSAYGPDGRPLDSNDSYGSGYGHDGRSFDPNNRKGSGYGPDGRHVDPNHRRGSGYGPDGRSLDPNERKSSEYGPNGKLLDSNHPYGSGYDPNGKLLDSNNPYGSGYGPDGKPLNPNDKRGPGHGPDGKRRNPNDPYGSGYGPDGKPLDPNDRRGSAYGPDGRPLDPNDPYGSGYGPDGRSFDPNNRKGSGYGPDGKPLDPNDPYGSGYGPDGRPLDPNDRWGSGYGPDGRPLDPNDRRGSGYDPDGRPLDPNDRRGSGYGPDGKPLDPNDPYGSGYGPDGRPLDQNNRKGSGYGPDGRPLDANDPYGSAYGPDGRPLDHKDRSGSAYGPDGKPLDPNDRRGSGYDPDGRPLDPNDRRGSAFDPDGKPLDPNAPYGSGYGPDGRPLDPNDRRGSGYGPDGRPLDPNDRRGSAYGPDGKPLDPKDRRGSAYGPDGRPLDPNDRRGSAFGPDGRPFDPTDRRGSAFGPDGKPLDPNAPYGSGYGPDGRPLDQNNRKGSGYGPDGKPLDPNDRRGSGYGPDGRPLDPNDRRGSAYGPDGKPLDPKDRRGSAYGPDGRPLDPNDRRGSAFGPDGRPFDPTDRRGSAYGPDGKPLDTNDRRGSGYGPDGRPLDPNDRRGSAYGPDGRPLDSNDRRGSGYGPNGKPFDSSDRRGSGYGPDGRPLDPNDRRTSGYGLDGRRLGFNDSHSPSEYDPYKKVFDSDSRKTSSNSGPDKRKGSSSFGNNGSSPFDKKSLGNSHDPYGSNYGGNNSSKRKGSTESGTTGSRKSSSDSSGPGSRKSSKDDPLGRHDGSRPGSQLDNNDKGNIFPHNLFGVHADSRGNLYDRSGNLIPKDSSIYENKSANQSRKSSDDFSNYPPLEMSNVPVPAGGEVEAVVKTPRGSVSYPFIEDNGNGSIGLSYQPQERGPHTIDIKTNDEHVQGSPFKYYACPIDDNQVHAYGPGLTHAVCGDPANFMITTKGAGAGGLALAVEGPSKADIHCNDNKDGTVNVSYLPTAPGEYKITAKFADKHIEGSPFTCKVTGEGKKRNAISVGSSSDLTLPDNLSEYDLRALNAYIVSPGGNEEPCFLKKLPKGNTGISFTPKEVGEHLVSVKRNGKHIKNSPFKIKVSPGDVGDASKVAATGKGLVEGKTHEKNGFFVDTKNAGYGGLSLSVEGPSKAEISCKDHEDGSLDVAYKPTEPGLYIINLKFADQHVPGSPFAVPISGPGSKREEEKIKRLREAVPVTEVGNQCRLTFKMPSIEFKDLEASVSSPSNKTNKAAIAELEDGLYAVNFVPYELGIHTVSVKYHDIDIPGSPFQFTVGPLQDGGAHRVHAGGSGLERGIQGQPADFNVWTREAGHGSLAISVEGPSKAVVDFKDRKDGSCHVSYTVEDPGEYSVGIRFNDKHIPGSPFKVYIQPSADDAERVRLSNVADNPIRPDAPQTMLLNMNGADGDVECKIVAPSGREDDCFITPLGNGEHSVRFVPKEEGVHHLHARFNGVHIPGSPFKIVVGNMNNNDPSTVAVYGKGIQFGKTGDKSSFVIDTTSVGAGTLSITVDGPSKVDLSCNEVESGYEVSYTPMVPGKYYVTVKYNGKNVAGSPFSVNIGGENLSHDLNGRQRKSSRSSMTMETLKRTSYIRHQYTEQRTSSSHSITRSSSKPMMLQAVSDPMQVKCSGSGLRSARIHRHNSFSVDCSNAGNNILYVGVYGPETPCDEVVIKHQGGKRYTVDYVVRERGKYIIFVKWGDEHVPGSPYHIQV